MNADWNGTYSEQINALGLKGSAASPSYVLLVVFCLVIILTFSTAAVIYPYFGRMLSTENDSSGQEVVNSRMENRTPQRTPNSVPIATNRSDNIFVNRMSPENGDFDPNQNENRNMGSTSPFHPRFNSPVMHSFPNHFKDVARDTSPVDSICKGMQSLTFFSPMSTSTNSYSTPMKQNESFTLEGIHARRQNRRRSGTRPSVLMPLSDAEINRRSSEAFLSQTPKVKLPLASSTISLKRKRQKCRQQPHPYYIQKSRNEQYIRFTARKLVMELPKGVTIHKSKGTQTGDMSDAETLEWDYAYS